MVRVLSLNDFTKPSGEVKEVLGERPLGVFFIEPADSQDPLHVCIYGLDQNDRVALPG